MSRSFSPRDVAAAMGVSESSLKRWIDRGDLTAQKTPGGHRRLELPDILTFSRKFGRRLQHPELLGVSSDFRTEIPPGDADGFLASLVAGDVQAASAMVVSHYLRNRRVSDLFDSVIVPALHRIGELWECGNLEVYQERRGCEICLQVLHELRRALPVPADSDPVAYGGTLDGDPYSIASVMAELVLRDCGWRAASLGNMLPFETLHRALRTSRPGLLWLSVSTIRDADEFTRRMNELYQCAESVGTALVLGGRALTDEIRRATRFTHYSDVFAHLDAFAIPLRQGYARTPVTPESD